MIACDQFTSDPDYWKRVRAFVGSAPSTLHMILPEAELERPGLQDAIAGIHETMRRMLSEARFCEYPASYLYVERTMLNGAVRRGIVGAVDLEQYDYHPGSKSPIRATERTVLERVPPRQAVRQGAALEFPHVLMLCDDSEHALIEPVSAQKEQLPKVYEFDLMEGGGHIAGWLLQGSAAEAFSRRMEQYSKRFGEKYQKEAGAPVALAVGDGNHSLAAAKSCYEALKAAAPGSDFSGHPSRWALVELENIHDPALEFTPIHRILSGVDVNALLSDLQGWCAPGGYSVNWRSGEKYGTIYLDRSRGALAAAVLQDFLDGWLDLHPGTMDYIHGEDVLSALAAKEGNLGFFLPPLEKKQLFPSVIAGGTLPRKTFSMGHDREKRYYLEGRKIQ